MSSSLAEFYLSASDTAISTRNKLRQDFRRVVLLRSVIFLMAVFAYAAGYDGYTIFYAVCVALLLLFARLIWRHRRIKEELLACDAKLSVLAGILARFDDKWKELPEDGTKYLHPTGHQSIANAAPQFADLHVFGHASLYQYLCRARTKAGRDRLAASFHTEMPVHADVLIERQGAVQELAEHRALALELESSGALLPEGHDSKRLVEALNRKVPFPASWRLAACAIFITANIITIFCAAASMLSWIIPGTLVALSFLLAWMTARQTETALTLLAPLAMSLATYEYIFRTIEGTRFQSSHLLHLQNILKKYKASDALHRLSRLASWCLARRNFFFYALANGLFLFDFLLERSFHRWCLRDGASLSKMLDVWSEFEVLISLSTIPVTRSHYCYPRFLPKESGPHIHAQSLENPLIPETKDIANDADFSASTTIVTGSNMSGKTTWLRTIGMSVVLAWAGAPVCAEDFAITPFSLYTSIRVEDDLAHGISTFYAELLRIKDMVVAESLGQPLLLLIDEIFKGTNSADRIIGARAALAHLTNSHTITLVSTHDFELCSLQVAGGIINNVHFEEHYVDGKIAFDYKMKDGRCLTTNAEYLLKMVGIL